MHDTDFGPDSTRPRAHENSQVDAYATPFVHSMVTPLATVIAGHSIVGSGREHTTQTISPN